MTTETLTPNAIFADARLMYAQALERWEAGDIRDAAEKGWCAMRRAAEALVLARTGQPCPNTSAVSRELRALGCNDDTAYFLAGQYGTAARYLHGDCFYSGLCEPLDDTERRIREAASFIATAADLAAAGA